MSASSAFGGVWQRLVAGTHEPENDNACWRWRFRTCHWGYGRFDIYVPGLKRRKTLMAHVAAYVAFHWSCASADELWLAYVEFRCSGLELDHLCEVESCIFIEHLDPVTRSENMKRLYERKRT